jgi:hypothetical protein
MAKSGVATVELTKGTLQVGSTGSNRSFGDILGQSISNIVAHYDVISQYNTFERAPDQVPSAATLIA